ncbi:hypothetical protein GGI07_001639 [Coemansia sp. Benny D115]|nr:hypothetical protein GGI07_001639 [Coemansia sp. Benny D115]
MATSDYIFPEFLVSQGLSAQSIRVVRCRRMQRRNAIQPFAAETVDMCLSDSLSQCNSMSASMATLTSIPGDGSTDSNVATSDDPLALDCAIADLLGISRLRGHAGSGAFEKARKADKVSSSSRDLASQNTGVPVQITMCTRCSENRGVLRMNKYILSSGVMAQQSRGRGNRGRPTSASSLTSSVCSDSSLNSIANNNYCNDMELDVVAEPSSEIKAVLGMVVAPPRGWPQSLNQDVPRLVHF